MFERSEYKGKPILVLKRDDGDKFPFSFGLSKAKLILENIEEIEKFVSQYNDIKTRGALPLQTKKNKTPEEKSCDIEKPKPDSSLDGEFECQ